MPGITYNLDIPLATNNPSVDQPNMKVNTNAIDTLLAVDHISFNTTNGGQHAQVTFPAIAAPGAQAALASVIYSAAGTANVNAAEAFFKNSGITLLLSAVKAFGKLNGTSGVIGSNFNATSSRVSAGVYDISLTSGAVTSSDYVVLISCQGSTAGAFFNICPTYTITNSSLFTIRTYKGDSNTALDVHSVCFAVLQL